MSWGFHLAVQVKVPVATVESMQFSPVLSVVAQFTVTFGFGGRGQTHLYLRHAIALAGPGIRKLDLRHRQEAILSLHGPGRQHEGDTGCDCLKVSPWRLSAGELHRSPIIPQVLFPFVQRCREDECQKSRRFTTFFLTSLQVPE